MPPSLSKYPFAGIDQQDHQVSRRGSGGHITGVLLMSRTIGNDKFASRRREIAISYIDGDTLFALRTQAVSYKRKVEP